MFHLDFKSSICKLLPLLFYIFAFRSVSLLLLLTFKKATSIHNTKSSFPTCPSSPLSSAFVFSGFIVSRVTEHWLNLTDIRCCPTFIFNFIYFILYSYIVVKHSTTEPHPSPDSVFLMLMHSWQNPSTTEGVEWRASAVHSPSAQWPSVSNFLHFPTNNLYKYLPSHIGKDVGIQRFL